MNIDDQREIQLQVQCRDGPIHQRNCTDWACCLIYLLVVAGLITLAVMSGNYHNISAATLHHLLQYHGGALPFLSTYYSLPSILKGWAIGIVLCIVVVVTIYIIPAIAAYLFIPIMLVLMVLLGVAFIYRYFGHALPFVNRQFQSSYVASYDAVFLIIGILFIIGFIVALAIILSRQNRIKFIYAMLKLAKICFWQNVYLFAVSIILSGISIGMMVINVYVISMSITSPTGQYVIYNWPLIIVVVAQMLWTHGVLQSYSDFLYQSIGVFWYFNQYKYRDQDYSHFGENFCTSLGLTFRHFGTIAFGSFLVYYPESLNSMLLSLSEKHEECYTVCCCCHKYVCNSLSKYAYIGTIMYGHSYCRASSSIKNIRSIAKHTFPELYMLGSFFVTIMKIFIISVTMLISFFIILTNNHYSGSLNYFGPLIAILLVSQEIANHFMNATGVIGDTIYLTYVLDFNCQTSNFGNLNADHCPKDAYAVINEAKISRYSVYD